MTKTKLKDNKYDPREIESYWQKIWEEQKIYSPNLDASTPPCTRRCGASLRTKKPFDPSASLRAQGKPFYNLMMFPYPSAEGMHVGNMYAFTGADVYGRFKRMLGFDVLEPIGLDGFGIHSENYAIKIGRHPKEQAKISEANFYRQLRATGNGFDWSRKLETYDSKYYKWTQWMFIQLFKAGLAYRKRAMVNFCPSCKTVLADEQVIDGRCERCATLVIREQREQWFFRITHYAEKLLGNIEKLNWSQKVKTAQRAWIGKSEGALITFKIKNSHRTIDVFTTRPDTLFGATFLVVSPEHPLVADLFGQGKDVMNYLSKAVVKSEQERIAQGKGKEGVPTWYSAINPVNNQEIPIWIADYVLMGYGTGAIMGVPAHDQRDFEFAKKYKLAIKTVILGIRRKPETPESLRAFHAKGDSGQDGHQTVARQARMTAGGEIEEAYIGEGVIINSGEWNGRKVPEDIGKVIDWLEQKSIGRREVTYHLRDWLISRQRYWGPPIPLIYCNICAKKGESWFTTDESLKIERKSWKSDHASPFDFLSSTMRGWFPVQEKDLPVLLPDVKEWKPTGTGKSPLATVESFINTFCPNCKSPAKRETDVSDNFLDSAWYFFRYLSTDIDSTAFDIKRAKNWLPVKMYIGGAEHSVLHLLYARFITMVLKDIGFIEFEEPFSRFYAHGLLVKEGAKMSKSKGNVVVPDEYIRKFGADTLRLYLMFLGPFNQGGDFYDTALEGMYRFIKRVWRLILDSCHPELVSGSPSPVPSPLEGEGQGEGAEIPKSIRQAQDPEFTEGQVRNDTQRRRMMHKTIKKVTEDIEHLRYNTAIAAMMEWYNYLKLELRGKKLEVTGEEVETFLKLLAPFAPHVTEELYHNVILRRQPKDLDSSSRLVGTQNDKKWSIHLQPWPTFDPKFLEEDEVTIVVQVNGKVRATLEVKSEKLKVKSYVEELARKSGKVKEYLEGKEIEKVVYVEGKVINFVTG
ncbi:MAG: class I tRNA ligase family protein [Patescibacteria group bacterium]